MVGGGCGIVVRRTRDGRSVGRDDGRTSAASTKCVSTSSAIPCARSVAHSSPYAPDRAVAAAYAFQLDTASMRAEV